MAHARAAIALDPRLFGRAFRLHSDREGQSGWAISDDAKLFATTFAAGFLFVSILIA
ncbi:MAG TPA: hypothetical protein VHN55_05605 [Sphingomicrobium sp.]|nr:hypothetical protein [Sphingomicrobium sp.]